MVKEKDERMKALDTVLSSIEKDFGKEAVMRLGEKTPRIKVAVVSTGALPLDIALGVGGLPRGRVVEIFGPEGSGKSTLAMVVISQVQKLGGIGAYIDAEHAFDPDYAKKLGVDVENLFISQPDSGEQALEIAERLSRSGAIDIITIDSVAALVPRAEIEGEIGEQTIGIQARLMSQALRKLVATLAKSKTIIIFINQLRQKIGVMFGSPETTPGGLALKFYASVRLDIRRIESIKHDEVVIGGRVRVKVVKNKVAPPFRQAEFDLLFTEGIPRERCIVDLGISEALIEKAGTWLIYKGEKIGQGREKAVEYLKEHSNIADEIEEIIRKKYFPKDA